MRKLFLISILSVYLYVGNVYGQYFNDTTYMYGTDAGTEIVKISDTLFAITYQTTGDAGGVNIGYALINDSGKVLKKRFYNLPGYYCSGGGYSNSLILSKNHQYLYHTGEKWISSTQGWSQIFIKLNLNLDTLFLKTLTDTIGQFNGGRSIFEDEDGILHIGGWINPDAAGPTDPNQSEITITKYDSLGNLIKYMWVHTPGGEEDINVMPISKDKYFVSGSYATNLGFANARPTLWVIDTSGSVLYQKTISAPAFCGFKNLLVTNDGNCIAVGVKNYGSSGGYSLYSHFIVKFNQQAQIIWQKEFSSFTRYYLNGLFNSVELTNGDILVSGLSTVVRQDSSIYGVGLIYMLDANGNSKWYKTYDRSDEFTGYNYSVLHDFVVTNNGYYAIGRFSADQSPVWLIKTDSLGCDSYLNCDFPIWVGLNESKNLQSDLLIYPNPVSGTDSKIYIYENHDLTGVNYSIFNNVGLLLKESTLNKEDNEIYSINIEGINNGLYVLKVFQNHKSITKRIIINK